MTDFWKMVFTYLIAILVIVGGGAMLMFAPTLDPLVQGAIIASIGSVIAFIFGGEVQTRTARQQERAFMTTPNGYTPTVTYTAADPAPEETDT